jgi:glutathione S-transferase
MRARMALHVSGIEYEHREVLLRDKPSEMLDASPKGTVPVFIKDDGGVIDESLDLAIWALEQNDPNEWLRAYDAKLVARIDGPFKHHLDRYKYASRHDEAAIRGDVDLSHRDKAEEIVSDLNQLVEKNSYLSGAHQSLTDIAIFPFLRQFVAVQPDWWNGSPYAALRDWLTAHIESDLFKAVMVKHPVWVSPNSV